MIAQAVRSGLPLRGKLTAGRHITIGYTFVAPALGFLASLQVLRVVRCVPRLHRGYMSICPVKCPTKVE